MRFILPGAALLQSLLLSYTAARGRIDGVQWVVVIQEIPPKLIFDVKSQEHSFVNNINSSCRMVLKSCPADGNITAMPYSKIQNEWESSLQKKCFHDNLGVLRDSHYCNIPTAKRPSSQDWICGKHSIYLNGVF